MSVNALFRSDLKVVNIGLTAFKPALDDAQVPAVQVDWKPPVDVDARLMERIKESQPAIDKANAEVMKTAEELQKTLVNLVV